MSLRQEIRSISGELNASELLRHLILERFPGETVITSSLRAPSICVLNMVSEIDPATPVVFCQRPPVFEESAEYRAQIVEQLGLTNVVMNDGRETEVAQGDRDHCERMWVHYRDMPGRSFQLLHINDCLAKYKCWISAVYHVDPSPEPRNRVDVEGKLIKVDPLARWSKKDVQVYMSEKNLPYHKMAKRQFNYKGKTDGAVYPMYHF